ncbi:MAG: hypothetical protein KDH09_01505, partial [Chrysiogenetes bacterium]|nr:hypothetical protein [Chrysiogenetes bacterium]
LSVCIYRVPLGRASGLEEDEEESEADEHYEKCLERRKLSLNDVFQAKLGWLVGNIYSRVGTEDWVPAHKSSDEFNEMIQDTLDSQFRWVPEKVLRVARKQVTPEVIETGREAIWEHLDGVVMESKRDQLLNRLEVILEKTSTVDPGARKKILNMVRSDPVISQIAPVNQY